VIAPLGLTFGGLLAERGLRGTPADIWVAPFEVLQDGVLFGPSETVKKERIDQHEARRRLVAISRILLIPGAQELKLLESLLVWIHSSFSMAAIASGIDLGWRL
jgi:hypothetical protein